MPPDVSIVRLPQQAVYGILGPSSDKTVARVIPALAKQYYAALGQKPDTVLPFYVLSRNYKPDTGLFELFCGGEIPCEGLVAITLPAGAYGKMTVRPQLGVLWGPAVGNAKRHFYTQWLPRAGYEALNMEYEYHTQKSMGKKPEIELLFALREQ